MPEAVPPPPPRPGEGLWLLQVLVLALGLPVLVPFLNEGEEVAVALAQCVALLPWRRLGVECTLSVSVAQTGGERLQEALGED